MAFVPPPSIAWRGARTLRNRPAVVSLSFQRPWLASRIGSIDAFGHANAAFRRVSTEAAPQASSSPPLSRRRSSLGRRFGLAALLASGVAAVTLWASTSSSSTPRLTPYAFTRLTVHSVESHTRDSKIISLALPTSLLPLPPAWNEGDIPSEWLAQGPIQSIFIKEPSLQIERAYTPLDDFDRCEKAGPSRDADHLVRILVKRYEDGEVSRYLHRLKAGDSVEIRGPVKSWPWEEGKYDDVAMIVGGTGITPAYQLLQSQLASTAADSLRRPRFTLLYASPSPSTVLLRRELDRLRAAHPDRVRLAYFVDRLDEGDALPHLTTSIPDPSLWSRIASIFSSTPFSSLPSNFLSKQLAAEKEAKRSLGLEKIGRMDESDLLRWLPSPRSWDSSSTSHGDPGPSEGTAKGPQVSQADAEGRKSGNAIVLVCGPDPMVAAISGPRSRDGRSQGPLRGMLGQLGYRPDEIFKL